LVFDSDLRGIAFPPHRSQIRDNYLQLVPRDSGDDRRQRKPERLALFLLELCCVLPTDRHRGAGIAIRRLSGRERLSGARRVFLSYSQLQCPSRRTLRAKFAQCTTILRTTEE